VPTELTRSGRALLRRTPLAGAGRLLDALESGEVTPRQLRRLATELEHLERLLFPVESGGEDVSRRAAVAWRR
jgi:hypothetical protein